MVNPKNCEAFVILNYLKSGYQKIQKALKSTGALLGQRLTKLFKGSINESTLEELEEILYEADLGVETAMELTEYVRELHKAHPKESGEFFLDHLKKKVLEFLIPSKGPQIEDIGEKKPKVIFMVGVNGSGKTTSTAKIAGKLKGHGKKVLVGAADTFRAAAVEQLTLWAERLDLEIVKGHANADPAAVAYDALSAAQARGCDAVLIDTAGRLHTKSHLMAELEKIRKSCHKVLDRGPDETLLVLDATIGQNAIDQATTFHKSTPITGIILTKLDGTAKGGIVIAVQRKLGIPVKYIGVGEGAEDLQEFDGEQFVEALFGNFGH